jgi:ribose 5-phosphate isomerase
VKKNTQELKKRAAERSVKFIESGMVVGLGHGSTAIFAVKRIAKLLKGGELSPSAGEDRCPGEPQGDHRCG